MIQFVYRLREAGVPVSIQDILEFYRGLHAGLAPDVDRLFLLARLVFVRKMEHMDAFERVFHAFFFGEGEESVDWDALMAQKPFDEWLQEGWDRGLLSPDAIREWDNEELLRRFGETAKEQDGEHHGGDRWVGTGGRSPDGHGGRRGGGLRVYGKGLHGTAQKVIESRRFIDYRRGSPLRTGNLRQVLTSIKSLRPIGPETELDVDETIRKTAANGGEIELVYTRELRNRVDMILLVDNGGSSMIPYVEPVRVIFGRIRDSFRDVKTYYFHNCLYGVVYADPERRRAVSWDKLLSHGRCTRLILIGDANMAPMELMASHGAIDPTLVVRKPGYAWLQDLRHTYPVSVWLNPIPKERWSMKSPTIERISRIFPMEDLTLGGLRNAVEYLNERGRYVDSAV